MHVKDDIERGAAVNERKWMDSGTNAWDMASRRLSEGLTVEQVHLLLSGIPLSAQSAC